MIRSRLGDAPLRITTLCALGGLLTFAGIASAEQAELVVFLDLDRDPATGCASTTSEGEVLGSERMLRTIVDLDTEQVTAVSESSCIDPLAGIFGVETPVETNAMTPWSVVTGDGSSGSTLIETYLPLASAPEASTVSVSFTLSSLAGNDALLTTTGVPNADAITIALRALSVSALGGWALVHLGFVLLCATLVTSRRRLHASAALALALLLAAASPSLVRAALGDGALRAWSGDERVATDPSDDAPEGADILAAFAFVDAAQGVLFIRVDARLGPALCLAWPTVDPGTGYSCSQEPPPDPPPFANRVAFTFDDGPSLVTTPSIVATLRSEGVPATFFMVGSKLVTAAERALALEIHDDPLFEVANHSYTHPNFTTLTIEQARDQITATNQNLRLALGDACFFPRFFRIPYSASNCAAATVVREQGLSMVGFHVNTLDWCYGQANGYCAPAQVSWLPTQYRNDMVGWVLTQFIQSGGGVAIMHDTQVNTASQLPAIITTLRNAGAIFVRLDDASVFPLINAAVNPPEPPACCDGEIH